MLGPLRRAGYLPVGADLSIPMLDEARRERTGLVRCSAFALPFRRDAFAAVASVRLLHHYRRTDRVAILRELARVARDRAVVTVFDAASVKHRRRRRKEARRGRPSLRFGVDLAVFRDELEEAGIRPGRMRRLLPGFAELAFVSGAPV
jgi:ubiquinone/menaquinone biosynthesis C-methylase UbiE